MLADGVTPFALSALKYGLFALLFLFVWRSMRWVVRGPERRHRRPRVRVRSRQGRAPPVPAAPPGPSSVVIHAAGQQKPRSVKVAASMAIGRAPECELMLDDTYVSQQHARAVRQERLLVRRGPGLDERDLRERAAPRRPGDGAARRSDPRGHDRAGAAAMKIEVGVATDIGRVREGNEDSYLVEPPLYAVADGMGGHRGGEVASQLALETVEALFREGDTTLAEQVREANRAVFARSQEDRNVSGMGTTLTAAQIDGRRRHARPRRRQPRVPAARGRAPPAHRRPHAREPHGEGRRDHRVRGRGPSAPQRPHPHARHRGRGRTSTRTTIPLMDGDRLLLCSDGLHRDGGRGPAAGDPRGRARPAEDGRPAVKAANRAGGVDNITVVVLDAHDDGSDDAAAAERGHRPDARRTRAPRERAHDPPLDRRQP